MIGTEMERYMRKMMRMNLMRMLKIKHRQQLKTIQTVLHMTTVKMRLNPETVHLEPVMETETERHLREMMQILEKSRRQQS